MVEFPKHLVCHSESFYIGQKIPALSEDAELKPGHNYFLLPNHLFHSVLSFVTIASFASSPSLSSSKQAFLRNAAAAATCQPFDIQRTPSGSLKIRVSDDFISKLMLEEENVDQNQNQNPNKEKEKAKGGGRVCTTPQLQKDYTQLVGCRQWKPKLETIRESERRKLSSTFGMKRRRKKKNKSQSQSQIQSHHESHLFIQQQHHLPSSSSTTTTSSTTLTTTTNTPPPPPKKTFKYRLDQREKRIVKFSPSPPPPRFSFF